MPSISLSNQISADTQNDTQNDTRNDAQNDTRTSEPKEVDAIPVETRPEDLYRQMGLDFVEIEDLLADLDPRKGEIITVTKFDGLDYVKVGSIRRAEIDIDAYFARGGPGTYRCFRRDRKRRLLGKPAEFVVPENFIGSLMEDTGMVQSDHAELLNNLVVQSQNYERERNAALMDELRELKQDYKELVTRPRDDSTTVTTILAFMEKQSEADRKHQLELEKIRFQAEQDSIKARQEYQSQLEAANRRYYESQIESLKSQQSNGGGGIDEMFAMVDKMTKFKEALGIGEEKGSWIEVIKEALPVMKDIAPIARDMIKAVSPGNANPQVANNPTMIGNDSTESWQHYERGTN